MEKECFVGYGCVQHCPRALAHAHYERDDDMLLMYDGMEKLECKDCRYNTQNCKECFFYMTESCKDYKGGLYGQN